MGIRRAVCSWKTFWAAWAQLTVVLLLSSAFGSSRPMLAAESEARPQMAWSSLPALTVQFRTMKSPESPICHCRPERMRSLN